MPCMDVIYVIDYHDVCRYISVAYCDNAAYIDFAIRLPTGIVEIWLLQYLGEWPEPCMGHACTELIHMLRRHMSFN